MANCETRNWTSSGRSVTAKARTNATPADFSARTDSRFTWLPRTITRPSGSRPQTMLRPVSDIFITSNPTRQSCQQPSQNLERLREQGLVEPKLLDCLDEVLPRIEFQKACCPPHFLHQP